MATKIRIAFRTWLYKILGYDPVGVSGSVSWVVRDKDGNITSHPKTFWQRLRGQPANLQAGTNHNIVTSEGDALIADLMQETPERTKVNNASGVIGVGTGFATEGKAVDEAEVSYGRTS